MCHTFVAYFLDVLRGIDLIRTDVENNNIYSKIEFLNIVVNCALISDEKSQAVLIKYIRYKSFNSMIQFITVR